MVNKYPILLRFENRAGGYDTTCILMRNRPLAGETITYCFSEEKTSRKYLVEINHNLGSDSNATKEQKLEIIAKEIPKE